MRPRILLFLSLALGVSAFAAPPLVRNPRPLPMDRSAGASEVHAGDFGGDAAKDLLIVVPGKYIEVLLNEAGGVTGTPVLTAIPDTRIGSTATGDLDADGDLDVAFAVWEPEQVVTYLNAGNGTFTRGTVVTGQRPGQLAIADFTRDGHADLALGRETSGVPGSYGELAILAGNGAGAFAAPLRTALSHTPRAMRVLDANGDGAPDLLHTYFQLDLALNKGDGTFTVANVSHEISPDFDLATGDFDGDGDVDFVITGDTYLQDGFLRVFRGAGNGTFTAAGDYFGLEYQHVSAADVDADGQLDLIANDSGHVAVLRGNGNATFDAPELWHAGQAGKIVAGDFTRDGVADLVMLGGGGSTGLQLIAGTGGGRFDAYRGFLPAAATPYFRTDRLVSQVTAADMNGDGAPDVVAVVTRTPFGDSDLVVMLNANDGAGTLSTPIVTETNIDAGSGNIAAGDVNGDGKQDVVVVVAYGGTAIPSRTYLGRGDGTFHAPVEFPQPPHGGSPRLADLTGDGVLDLVVTQYQNTVLRRGRNNGQFDDLLTLAFPAEGIGDVNGDGRADLAGHGFRDTVVAINNGDGTAFAQTTLPDGDYECVAALADLDGDGALDLLAIDYAGTFTRLGNGDGTFGEARFFSIDRTGYGPTSHAEFRMGDFNADGTPDFTAHGERFYLGDGSGVFGGYARLFPFYGSSFDVADFDGNGTDDVAVAAGSAGLSVIRTAIGPDATLTASVELTLMPNPPQYAVSSTHVAKVTGGAIPPTGAVLHAVNGVPFAMLEVSDPAATAIGPGLPLGTHTITATYSGDDHYAPATATLEPAVVRATTYIFAQTSPLPSACGTEVLVNVQFGAATQPGLPGPSTGLAFREGDTQLQVRLGPQGEGWYLISGLGTGTHTITVEFPGDANYEPSSGTVTKQILPSLDATISAGSAVYAGGTGYASARLFAGATYAWTITNGTIDSGQGTANVRYTAGATGEVTLGLTITRTWCSASAAAVVPISQRQPNASMFHLLRACRVVDSRSGAPLADGATVELALANACGIPADAKSLVVNVTVVGPTGTGWLSLYEADAAWPGTSTINYRAGKTRGNGAIVPVSSGARMKVRHDGPPVHFLIDVLGFFR